MCVKGVLFFHTEQNTSYGEETVMSYVDEVIERVVKENPNEPEFHQAVKEVLNSLRSVGR